MNENDENVTEVTIENTNNADANATAAPAAPAAVPTTTDKVAFDYSWSIDQKVSYLIRECGAKKIFTKILDAQLGEKITEGSWNISLNTEKNVPGYRVINGVRTQVDDVHIAYANTFDINTAMRRTPYAWATKHMSTDAHNIEYEFTVPQSEVTLLAVHHIAGELFDNPFATHESTNKSSFKKDNYRFYVLDIAFSPDVREDFRDLKLRLRNNREAKASASAIVI